MSAGIKLRKCTICQESFKWNGTARCVCKECRKQSAPGSSRRRNDKDLFIVINHSKRLRVSA